MEWDSSSSSDEELGDESDDPERCVVRQPTYSEDLQLIADQFATTPFDEVSCFHQSQRFLSTLLFQTIKPLFQDVLRDYEESQVVLVDGDSLLLEMICMEKIDWSHGGQFLHLTYLVESFLAKLQACGAMLNVVAFTATKSIWSSSPSSLLARNAIVTHLKYNTSVPVYDTFQDWWDPKWKEFVVRKKPVFMLMSSGDVGPPWMEECATGMSKLDELGGWKECCNVLLNSLLVTCLSLEVDCVFIGDLQTEVNRIVGSRVRYTYQENQARTKVGPVLHLGFKYLLGVFESASLLSEAHQQSPARLIDAAVGKSVLEGGGWRLICAAVAVACCLTEKSHDDCEMDVLRLFLVHILLLEKLAVDVRPQILPANEDAILAQLAHPRALKNLLPQLQLFFCQALESVQSRLCRFTIHRDEDAINSLPSCTGVADLMDGRLLYNVIYHVARKAGHHATDIADDSVTICFWPSNFTEIWTAVQSLITETLVPTASSVVTTVPLPVCVCKWPSQTSPDGVGLLDGSAALLEVDSPLIDDAARKLHDSLPHTRGFQTRGKTFPSSEFEEHFHWHSKSPIGDGLLGYDKTEGKKKDWRELKQQQKHTKFIHDYAVSLDGNIHTEPIVVKRRSSDRVEAAEKGKKTIQHGMKSGAKPKAVKKSQIIIEQNEQRKRDQRLTRETERLKNIQRHVGEPGSATLDGINELYQFIATCTFSEQRLKAKKTCAEDMQI